MLTPVPHEFGAHNYGAPHPPAQIPNASADLSLLVWTWPRQRDQLCCVKVLCFRNGGAVLQTTNMLHARFSPILW